MEKSFSLMDVGIGELRHGFSKALCHTTRCPRQFTVTPMLSPPGPCRGPGQLSPPQNFLSTLFFGFFFFFLTSKHVATATPAFYRRSGEYSSRVQLLHGNTSQQPLFPSLLGEKEADPTVPCSLDHGVHTSWAKTGGWPVLWRDPLGLEEHPKNPLQ